MNQFQSTGQVRFRASVNRDPEQQHANSRNHESQDDGDACALKCQSDDPQGRSSFTRPSGCGNHQTICASFASDPHPRPQIASRTQQEDAGPFQFEVRILQSVVAFIGLIAGVGLLVQCCSAGIHTNLNSVEIGFGNLGFQVRHFPSGSELLNRALQLQSLF